MAYDFIDRLVKSRGKFPVEVDPSGWLDTLELLLTRTLPFVEERFSVSVDIKTPFPISLWKFTDNPGFYMIKPYLPGRIAVTHNPLPFRSHTDEDAISKLREEIENYNKDKIDLFYFAGMEEISYDKDFPRQLVRMADHPSMAHEISNEGRERYSVC